MMNPAAMMWTATALLLVLAGFVIYQCFDALRWGDRQHFRRIAGPALLLTAAFGGTLWVTIAYPDLGSRTATGFPPNYDCGVAKGVCAPTLPAILQNKGAPRPGAGAAGEDTRAPDSR